MRFGGSVAWRGLVGGTFNVTGVAVVTSSGSLVFFAVGRFLGRSFSFLFVVRGKVI